MKKIISALVMGALVFGAASAETKLAINYRNGTDAFKYTDKGDNTDATKVLLNQTGYNAGKDSVTLSATGDIFNFKAILQPTVASSAIVFNNLEMGAKIADFHAMAGWWRDGSSNANIRVKKDADDGNWEGAYFESFKPGSIFKSRPTTFISDMSNIAVSDTLLNAFADYTVNLDDFKIKLQGNVMFDRAIQKTGDDEGDYGREELNAGAYGWGANVNFQMPGFVEVEAIAKGNSKWLGYKNKDGDYAGAYALGLYVMPKMISGVNASIGGALGIVDGDVSEIAFDLRARWNSGAISLTTMNNITIINTAYTVSNSVVSTDTKSDAELGNSLGTGTLKGTGALWDMVSLRYKLSDTFTPGITLAQITILDQEADSNKLGTTIRVTPFVQVYAAKNASIVAAFSLAYSGIGADDASSISKDADLYINVPVLFRVKM